MARTPVAVEVWRNGRVESRHRVRVCVADASGRVALAVGDIAEPVYPRSAVKPFLALALVESGAADAYGVSEAELALACASHGGEAQHVTVVEAWLARLGLDETALACGPHAPTYPPAAAALIRAGRSPRRVHNNCSGKHAGMLAVALHRHQPTQGYEHEHHPVQVDCAAAVAALAGLDRLPAPGIDGCSLPNHPLPLSGLARAAANLADPTGVESSRGAALARIGSAMRARPQLVAGTGRCCTAVMQTLPGVIAKTGAEGVYIAALQRLGLGVAIKVEDGTTRAAETVLLAMLDRLQPLDDGARATLAPFIRPTLVNYAGTQVGHIAMAPDWPAS